MHMACLVRLRIRFVLKVAIVKVILLQLYFIGDLKAEKRVNLRGRS